MVMRRSMPKLSSDVKAKLDAVDYGRMSGQDLLDAYDGGSKPRDTHEIARKAAATRKARGGLVGNLAKAGSHAKR